jgi:hypothetical protein
VRKVYTISKNVDEWIDFVVVPLEKKEEPTLPTKLGVHHSSIHDMLLSFVEW